LRWLDSLFDSGKHAGFDVVSVWKPVKKKS